MSKARITFRFEDTRRASGQASSAATGGEPALRPVPAPTPAPAPEKESRAGNHIVPLKHYEFEASDEPIVLEEKEAAPPKRSSARRLDPEYPYDYGAWQDTAEEEANTEADELERMIRETEAYESRPQRPRRALRFDPEALRADMREPVAPDDRLYESGYWEPDADERGSVGRTRRASSVRSRTPDGPAWWKIAGSAALAIATGVLFGTFVLNFFTGEPARDGGTDPLGALTGSSGAGAAEMTGDVPQTPDAGDAGAEAAGTAAGEAGPSVSIDLPERRMFLLQNGKFETLEGARTLADDMKSKGLAATIEEGDGFYVYAGVSSNRDAALRAGVKLQAAGVEVYVKPYELPSVRQVRWEDGSADALASYVAQGSGMVRMIGDLTLVHLEGDEPVAPEAATLEKVKAEHLALSGLQTGALAGLPADAQPMLERMDNAMRNAVVAVEEYGAHPDQAYLWSAQSALMDYLIAEKLLLTTIAME